MSHLTSFPGYRLMTLPLLAVVLFVFVFVSVHPGIHLVAIQALYFKTIVLKPDFNTDFKRQMLTPAIAATFHFHFNLLFSSRNYSSSCCCYLFNLSS